MSYENHWMRDVEAIIRKERKELVEEFLADMKERINQYKHINALNDSLIDLYRKWEGKLNK
ncbi:hypothetical protein LCGC14_2079800 [marine sediment metagenome]|uniref:Uncharacterized protein n=1 Tax=marine sediment metagenome TaxID=412755 RepID=A0A0F9EG53_9ZZZZ